MRVQLSIAAAAAVIFAVPAAAEDQPATTHNQTVAAKSAETKKPTKASGEKVCKRLASGKVCMTAEKWKQYEEMM